MLAIQRAVVPWNFGEDDRSSVNEEPESAHCFEALPLTLGDVATETHILQVGDMCLHLFLIESLHDSYHEDDQRYTNELVQCSRLK